MLPEVSEFLSVKYIPYGLFIKSVVYLSIYFEMQNFTWNILK